MGDNLAWFPHSTLDEVLFIIKIADVNLFLRRSLAIFTLFRLKIYLKQAYKLSDKRIQSYSNSETTADSKSKPAVRRGNVPFEPVEVLSYLMGNNRDGESWGTQTEAIKIYLKLKQLMDEM